MRRILKPGLCVVLGVVCCAAAEAQSHGRFRMGRGFRHQAAVTADTVVTGTFPVPGLGFDFAHVAAINRGRQQPVALVQPITSIIPIALPLFAPSAPVVIVQPPPVVIVQQPPAAVEVQEEAFERRRRERRVEPEENVERARRVEPPREIGEFVLVQRNGTILFAVAFSTEGGKLTYVTREGIRRSLPLADLDIETTRRMNEERGTSLHLPV